MVDNNFDQYTKDLDRLELRGYEYACKINSGS